MTLVVIGNHMQEKSLPILTPREEEDDVTTMTPSDFYQRERLFTARTLMDEFPFWK